MGGNFCDDSIVRVVRPWGIILFILNIIFPGVGTIISAFFPMCMGRSLNALALLFGVLQLLFCMAIIPWIWSIWHGYQIWKKCIWELSELNQKEIYENDIQINFHGIEKGFFQWNQSQRTLVKSIKNEPTIYSNLLSLNKYAQISNFIKTTLNKI